MPSVSRLTRVLRHPNLPPGTRRGLLGLEGRRRLRPRSAYPLGVGETTVFLSQDDFETDWKTLAWVLADEAYPGDFGGALVADVGAHKGYFAAYAFARGARTVVSYEPETANFDLLERAAASGRERGLDWQTRKAAVGAERGTAELHVMGGSWGHSFQPPEAFAKYEVGVERVAVEPLAEVLESMRTLAAGAPIVVKVNIEGAECRAILDTALSAWAGVRETFVETHPWAACDASALAAHLALAGLERAASPKEAVLRLQRGEAPRSDPRTAPS